MLTDFRNSFIAIERGRYMQQTMYKNICHTLVCSYTLFCEMQTLENDRLCMQKLQ